MPLVGAYLRARQPLPQDCCDGCVCTIYQTTIFWGTTYTDNSNQVQTTIESTVVVAGSTPPSPPPPPPQSHATPNSDSSNSNLVQNALATPVPSRVLTPLLSLSPVPTDASMTIISGQALGTTSSTTFISNAPQLSPAADVLSSASASIVGVGNGRPGPIFNGSSDLSRKTTNLGVIMGATLGGLLMIALLVSLAAYRRHRKNSSGESRIFERYPFRSLRGGDGHIAPFVSEPTSQHSKTMMEHGILESRNNSSTELSSKCSLAQERPHSVVDIPPTYVP